MRSGDPPPSGDLANLLLEKRSGPSTTVDVVSEAARWMKAALKGADVDFSYASCEERNSYGFARFTVVRSDRGGWVMLDLRIAEVGGDPYGFAEVHSTATGAGGSFPFFGNLRSDEQRSTLLHYVADFIVSTDDG